MSNNKLIDEAIKRFDYLLDEIFEYYGACTQDQDEIFGYYGAFTQDQKDLVSAVMFRIKTKNKILLSSELQTAITKTRESMVEEAELKGVGKILDSLGLIVTTKWVSWHQIE